MSIKDPISRHRNPRSPSPDRTSSHPRLTGLSGLRSRMTGNSGSSRAESSGSTEDQRTQDDPGGSSGAGWQGARKFIRKINRKRTKTKTESKPEPKTDSSE